MPGKHIKRLVEDLDDDLDLADETYVLQHDATIDFSGWSIAGVYAEKLEQLRGRRRKKIDNNTYLVHHANNDITVTLHATDVITYHPDGSMEFEAGQYQTRVTMERMNSMENNESAWKLKFHKGQFCWLKSRREKFIVPFTDGDVITADGTLRPQSSSVLAPM